MAKMRRTDAKSALGRQRAELRRGARGKVHVGDDTGSAAGRAAELEKVHRMQEVHRVQEEHRTEELEHARERAERLRAEDDRRQALALARDRRQAADHDAGSETLGAALLALVGELVSDGFRLTRTFVLLPFRVVSALRGHGPRESEA